MQTVKVIRRQLWDTTIWLRAVSKTGCNTTNQVNSIHLFSYVFLVQQRLVLLELQLKLH